MCWHPKEPVFRLGLPTLPSHALQILLGLGANYRNKIMGSTIVMNLRVSPESRKSHGRRGWVTCEAG
jgi:hypothetical protein